MLTKLGATGKQITVATEHFSETDMLLMRDGRDVHAELERRGKPLDTDILTFTRDSITGDLMVIVTHHTKVSS